MSFNNGTTPIAASQHSNGNSNGHANSVFDDVLETGFLLHDQGAEEAVIGSLLLDGETFAQVNRTLTPASFYSYPLRLIWQAIEALFEVGSPVDQVTVAYRLREEDQLGTVKMPYLVELANNCMAPQEITFYAGKVRRCQVQRDLIKVLAEAPQVVTGPDLQPHEMAERISDLVMGVAPKPEYLKDEQSLREALDQMIEEATGSGATRFGTGFKFIDLALGMGFERGSLSLLAGDTGLGKSTLAYQWALSWARLGKKVAFLSYEMSSVQLAKRGVAAQTAMAGRHITSALRDGTDASETVMDAVGGQSDLPITISTLPRGIKAIEGWVKRLRRDQGIDVLIVDHLQEMPSEDNAPNRALELDRVATRLKALARQEGILVLAVSQINRSSAGKKLTPAAIKDSGGISQSADNIIFIHEPDHADPGNKGTKMELTVGKNRDGRDGVSQSMKFEKHYNRFIEWRD